MQVTEDKLAFVTNEASLATRSLVMCILSCCRSMTPQYCLGYDSGSSHCDRQYRDVMYLPATVCTSAGAATACYPNSALVVVPAIEHSPSLHQAARSEAAETIMTNP